jgi:DNA-binding transcriptional regulator YdaS (Cro superfamily)
MKLNEWISQVPGRAKRLGDAFGASKSSVSQWRRDGVPVHLVRRVSDFTVGAVTVEELLADIEARRERVTQAPEAA